MIDKGKEFPKVMHDGRNDRRVSSERHKGVSTVLLHRVWLGRVDTQAGTASGGGPWPLVNCQNKKSLHGRCLRASVGQPILVSTSVFESDCGLAWRIARTIDAQSTIESEECM